MIDLRALRENPDRFREGCRLKGSDVDIDRLLALDAQKRDLSAETERLRAEQNALAKQVGPEIGKLSGQLKKAEGAERTRLDEQIAELKNRPEIGRAHV